jgi:hypothetical protein
MAYNLQTSVGNVTVVDGTLNTTSTSLALPGRNYAGYGAPVVQNWLSLLEHFASSGNTGPSNPLPGQLWWDKGNQQLKVYKNDLSTASILISGGSGRFANGEFDNLTTGTLTVTGVSTLGAVGNVKISGGIAGQVLSTNGLGGLSWVTQTGGGGGGSAVTSVSAGGGISVSSSTGDVVITNAGVTQIIPGSGISVNQNAGAVTITNTGGGGGAVANGISVYTATVYSSGTSGGGSPPPPNQNTGTFTFLPLPSQLTVPSGIPGATWLATPPTSVNTNVYVSTTTFSTTTPNLTVTAGTWSTPTLAFNTSGGLPGISTYTAAVYTRSENLPVAPVGGKWDFTTGTSGSTLPTPSPTWGWTPPADNPAVTTDKLYVSYATASTNTPQIPKDFGTWSTPVEIVSVGSQGAQGIRGFIPLAFIVVTSNPTTLNDSQLSGAFAADRTGTPAGTNTPPIGMGIQPIPGDAAQFYWPGPTGNGVGGVEIVSQYQSNGTWLDVYNTVLSGNVIAPGSVTINQLDVNDTYTLKIRGGAVPFGSTTGSGFWIDGQPGSAGNAYFGGNAIFAGNLQAAGGTFSGALSAATGTFSGSLSAASGTFTGSISAGQITSGSLNSGVVYTGSLNADQITAGAFTAARINNGEIGRFTGETDGTITVFGAIAGNPILLWGYVRGNDIASGYIVCTNNNQGVAGGGGVAVAFGSGGPSGEPFIRWSPVTITGIFVPPSDGDYNFQLVQELADNSGSIVGTEVSGTITAVHSRR